RDIRFCLVNSCRRMAHIGLRCVDTGVGGRDSAHLRSNATLLVGDLTFQCRLGGFSLFQGVLVRTRVDDEQELTLPDELVVVYLEIDDGALDLWGNTNQVREDFSVIG